MNIFYLDPNPTIAAQLQCDKHVVKMATETAQMLSTAHRVLDGLDEVLYDSIKFNWKDQTEICKKPKKIRLLPKFEEAYDTDTRQAQISLFRTAHQNHPSTKWVGKCFANYIWTLLHLEALLDEYKFRFNKEHGTSKVLKLLQQIPENISHFGKSPVPLCMPDEFVEKSSVKSYQNFYNAKDFEMKWTNRPVPDWYKK